MSDLLNIGASGLGAYSRALATVGDNIANAQTPGYARRTIELREAPAAGEIVLSRNSIRPGGVETAGVRRSVDPWLIEDARTASGEADRSSARLDAIDATERALDDGIGGIGESMTRIFTTADQLAADPANATLRAQFLQSVDDSAAAFRRTAAALGSAANGVAQSASITVDSLNTDLTALEAVNQGLRRARAGSANEAKLLDERDRLLDRISSALPVTASFDARGAVTLLASDGALPLVANGSVSTLSVSILANGQLAYAIAPGGTLAPSGGTLAGLSQGANHIAMQTASLDVLAAQFASDLNGWHQSGLDANGNPGSALLSGTSAATLVAVALTADAVAAADASASNGNSLQLANLRGSTGVEAGWAALVGQQAQQAASARAQDAAASTRRDGAFAARDMVGEVDLDREAAELLRFQQAYEAAARTVQVARETMQSILNIF
ncbi:flagellar hook-associated protein FlgK [Sphingorhabdus sp.]|jgi:flagellar hook-associated protein 1 FlgK|uniref:flagellar hook-associated protein FlgK n=1 Tax=Sphingorhabdus sp. TaxID=1902408 RepID=UPI002C492EB2|nr:flagellar hook-associated protein FlgK [Sphingorhabdus sp.]HMT41464.1 flagellar hook-associated protein FlgK [Sphingorhabdus sp.]